MYSFETAEDFFAPAANWPAWQDTLDRHHSELEAIHQCLSDGDATAFMHRGKNAARGFGATGFCANPGLLYFPLAERRLEVHA